MATLGSLNLYGGVNTVQYGPKTYIRGEYIEFTFPDYVTVSSYVLDFFTDNKPAVWYVLAKTKAGKWSILDSQDKRNTFRSDVTPEFAATTTFSGAIRTSVETNTIRLQIAESTQPSVKIKNFLVYDIIGVHLPFLIPFCEKTNSASHSGSLNFSCIDRFSIDAPRLNTTFFAVKHNVLEFGKGMARLKWN